jgi:putative MATE family efflux protein
LWLGVATNVIYLVLVFAFVYGWGWIPAMGVAGAAIANGVAFAVAGLVLLLAWWRGWLMLGFDRKPYWHKRRVRELLDIGYPAGIEQIVFRVGFFLFLGIIGTYYGTAAFAAYGIGVNVLSVCFVVGFGFSIASSTLVGQNLGAGDPEAATRAAWRSLRMSFVAMAVVGAVIIAFARPLAEFMTHDEEVIEHTIAFVWILGAMMPLMAIDFSIGGALRGAGDTRYPLRATLVGLLGMRCGLAVLFAWLGLGVEWIYAALIGDYLAKGLILLYRFRSGRWRRVFERMRRERARADAEEAAEAAQQAGESRALTDAGEPQDTPKPPR